MKLRHRILMKLLWPNAPPIIVDFIRLIHAQEQKVTNKTFTQEQIAELQAKAANHLLTRADVKCWHFWFRDDVGDMTVEPCVPMEWQTILSYSEAKQEAIDYLNGKIETFQGVLQRIEKDTEDACAERWLRRSNR